MILHNPLCWLDSHTYWVLHDPQVRVSQGVVNLVDKEAFQERLLPMFGDPTLVAEFDTSEIEALQESESERAKRLQTYVSEGIMTTDEARAELGLPAL